MPLAKVTLSPGLEHRINELATLQNGWLDGEDLTPTPAAFNMLRRILTLLTTVNFQDPALFPAPNGDIELQWRTPAGTIAAISRDGEAVEFVYNIELNQGAHLDNLSKQSDLAIVALFQKMRE